MCVCGCLSLYFSDGPTTCPECTLLFTLRRLGCVPAKMHNQLGKWMNECYSGRMAVRISNEKIVGLQFGVCVRSS